MKMLIKIIVIMISEQSLEGWDNNPNIHKEKDNNAPYNFFLTLFCGSRGSGSCGKTYLLEKY